MHAVTFTNAVAYAGTVDLHTHALADCFEESIDAWFFANTETYSFGAATVSRLNPTALLAHTILHGLKFDLSGKTRWILDAHVILKQRGAEVDWMDMIEFARRHNFLYRLKLGLQYADAQGFIQMPDHVAPTLDRHHPGWYEKFECNYLFKDKEYYPGKSRNSFGLFAQHVFYRAMRMGRTSRLPVNLFRVIAHHIGNDSWRGVIVRILNYRTPR